MWKLSQFTVARNLAERGLAEHVLVFNTASHKSLSAKVGEWHRILCALEAPEQAGPEVQAAISRLARLQMVVERTVDERARWSAHFEETRRHPPRIYPILAVTTACNIGCTYCYEEGVDGKTMRAEVVAGVLRWLERRIVDNGVREIYPALFGGEPMLYPKLLFALMDGLAEISARHGTRHGFACSSNGTLLDEALTAELARRGLTQIQISLDGPPEIHDTRRVGKRCEPTFEASLAGIRVARAHIRNVTLKVNFDRQNRPAIPALFDRLADEGLAEQVDVKLEAVAFQFSDSATVHDRGLVIPPEDAEMAHTYLQLTLEAERRGFRVRRDTAHVTPCMFSSEHGVIIGPDGSIYKCISLVGRTEYRVGTVLDDDYDAPEYARQMDTLKRLDECFDEACPYVPVCAGGCAYESLVRTGRYDLRFCTKEYLAEYHFKRNLMQHRALLEKLGMKALEPADLLLARASSAPRGSVRLPVIA